MPRLPVCLRAAACAALLSVGALAGAPALAQTPPSTSAPTSEPPPLPPPDSAPPAAPPAAPPGETPVDPDAPLAPSEGQAPSATPVQDSPPPQPAPEVGPSEPMKAPSKCCRWSARFDPFQIIFRRVALDAEIKIAGPFSVGVEPAWIFAGSNANLDEKGFGLLAYFGWTFSGRALRGFWLRAVGGFDAFDATLTHSKDETAQVKKSISTGIFGVMVGDSVVFGHDGGFTLSGGLGLGVATAPKTTLLVKSTNEDLAIERAVYFDDTGRVKLLGSLGVGVTF